MPPAPASQSWDALLDWCRAGLAGESAFLMDEQGLLVALAGKLGAEEAQGIGGRLVHLLEQADAMKGERVTRCLTIGFGASQLSGWRVSIGGGVLLTMGVFTAKPLPPEAGAVVARAFVSKRAAG